MAKSSCNAGGNGTTSISKRFRIDAQIWPNNGRVSLYDYRRFFFFFDIHRAYIETRVSPAFALPASARDIAGGRAPVNRINARNLYMRKNGEVKTNDSYSRILRIAVLRGTIDASSMYGVTRKRRRYFTRIRGTFDECVSFVEYADISMSLRNTCESLAASLSKSRSLNTQDYFRDVDVRSRCTLRFL